MDINVLTQYFKKATEILPKGAFLTTKDGEKINTMTIGWGSFGFIWGIPTAEVLVRQSRFTKNTLDNAMEFTLTFPYDDSMKEALGYCGSHSGRNADKIADCGLELKDANAISTPVVACKGLVFECKVTAKTDMTPDNTTAEIIDKWYKNGDLHTLYYAKIEDCYEIC